MKKYLRLRKNGLKKIKNTLPVLLALFCAVPDAGAAAGAGIGDRTVNLSDESKRVTLRYANESLETVLMSIQRQSGVGFTINETIRRALPTVSVTVENVTVEQALTTMLRGTGYRHRVVNNVITIERIPPPTSNQQSERRTVTGTVVDETGVPVPGVAVIIKGTHNGTATDGEGRFLIQVDSPNATLVFTFIGMIPVDQPLRAGQDNYNVTMRTDLHSVDEVIVTGFGNRSRHSFTGSAVVVSKDELLSAGSKNVLHSLAAFVPGMQMLDNNYMGSDPNTRPDILIRGRSSFTEGSTVPTFIVDGAEVNLDFVFDMDMNDVETVSVLKDASASALYGSKAANGVVVITTRPMAEGGLKVSYRGTFKVTVPDLSDYDMLNAAEKLEYERLAGKFVHTVNGIPSPGRQQYAMDERYNGIYQRIRSGVDTDWLSIPLRNAFANDHNIKIYGGDDKVRYHLTARYGNDAGVMKGSERKRYELGFKLSYNLNTKFFFQNSTTIYSVNSKDYPFGSFSDYVIQNPYDKPYNDDGTINTNMAYGKKNPVYEASLGSYKKGENFYVTNNFDARYQVTDQFRIEGSFSLTKYKNDTEQFISPRSQEFNEKEEGEKGSIEVSNTRNMSYQGKLLLTYNLNFGESSLLSVVGGGNIQSSLLNSNGYRGIGLFSDKLAHPAFATQYPNGGHPTGSNDMDRMLGGFLTANVIFQNRYFIDGSFRYEGSSKFGSNDRYAPFWSLGAGWNIHEMGWFETKPTDRIKLRGSVGYVGNASFSPYQAMTIYQYSADLYYGKGIGAVPMGIGNPDLKWERELSVNTGVDVNFFKNRLDVTAEYYFKKTDNLLLPVTKAPSTGVAQATENLGHINNRGVEFRARVIAYRNQDWDWSLSLTASHNWNKIIKISEALKEQNEVLNAREQISPQPYYKEGESISALKVVPSAGIDPATGREIYFNRYGQLTYIYDYRDKVVYGDTDPKLYGILGSYLSWKGFSLNLMFQYSLKATMYNETLARRVEGSDPENNADRRVFSQRWKQVGDYVKYRHIADQETPQPTSRFVEKESYISLRTISVAYEFQPEIYRKIGLSRLRLELLSNDLFRSSTVKQERGLDYPFARTFELSISATF